jgi:dienelactone hydrolase
MKHGFGSMARCTAQCLCIGLIAPVVGAQQFDITPANPVLMGEALSIKLSRLPANEKINIVAERVMRDVRTSRPSLYRSQATFTVPASGTLDLASARPENGTYKRAEVNGLFWSMSPVKADKIDKSDKAEKADSSVKPGDGKAGDTKASDGKASDPFADRKSLEVRLTVRRSADAADAKPLAQVAVQFVESLATVKTEAVEKFSGAKFSIIPPAAGEKRPAIILLGGSEGGSFATRGAPPLASRGFAVLALPYYSPADWQTQKAELPDLPPAFADIPVDRLNEARAWLQARADVDGTRIAIHGTSKGAEFALLAGVHLGWPSAIVAVVPTDVVWEGWGPNIAAGARSSFSVSGKPLPFVPYEDFGAEFAGYQTGDAVRIRRPQDKGRAANPAAAVAARIPVEKIKAPVLLIAGQEDQLWNSAMMAHNIAERRAEAKLETVSLIYTDAGHAIGGSGYSPTTQYDVELSKVGGTPEGNARAQADAWPKTMQFLKRSLGVK